MSMGLGHRYWVRVIKCEVGSLEVCLKFMNENKPLNEHQWYELRPSVKVKTKSCSTYICNLVEMEK